MRDTTESVTENIRRPTKEEQAAKEQHGIAGHCVKWMAGGSVMVEQVCIEERSLRQQNSEEQESRQNEGRKAIPTPQMGANHNNGEETMKRRENG